MGVTDKAVTLSFQELNILRSAISSELIATREMACWCGFGLRFVEGQQERVRMLEAIREKMNGASSATLEGRAP